MNNRISPLRDFLNRESSGGLFILLASLLGLIAANSPISNNYFEFFDFHISIGDDWYLLELSILKLINYMLMSCFFFIVGLEIKRELTSGHLSTFKKALLPFVSALGGMLVPALIYLAIAGDLAPRGWGVPVATDIALAIGLLSALGSSVAGSLRSFLLALAVIDDIGAILIIALFYSVGVNISWLAVSFASIGTVLLLINKKVSSLWVYFIFAFTLWFSLYKTGVHPTLAGVIIGLLTPNVIRAESKLVDVEDGSITVIEWLESKFHPVSTFFVVPLFAFANTGVVITADSIKDASQSLIAWGIFFGLVIGKPVGVLSAALLAKSMKIVEFPQGVARTSIVATGSAAGIGFTVAIFIAKLAFTDPAIQDIAVIAIIFASVISATSSLTFFKIFQRKKSV